MFKVIAPIFLVAGLAACKSTPSEPERPIASLPGSTARAEVAVPLVLAPAVEQEQGLTIKEALAHGPQYVIPILRSQIAPVESYKDLPTELRAEPLPKETEDKKILHKHLKKFKNMKLSKKLDRAEDLMEKFECSDVIESQALALSLERDFPENDAYTTSVNLHEKVITCADYPKLESYLRLSIFSIQHDQCPKAVEYLAKAQETAEGYLKERINYIKSFCAPNEVTPSPNPWSGYGILLGDLRIPTPQRPLWKLTAASGKEEWDRLLMTFIEATEKGEGSKVRYFASKLNFERFRMLPHTFQASVLVLMHFNGADLNLFQTLHRYLAENPSMVSKELLDLLFPVRYWKNIVEHTSGIDPVLVKSVMRQESAFNPAARSRAKAMGLMQVILPAARVFGVRKAQQLMEPDTNIKVGANFLKSLIQKFGSVELALAAYNAGPNLVREWQDRYPTANINLFVEMIPYSETREYVRLIQRNMKMYQAILKEKSSEPVILPADAKGLSARAGSR